MPVGTAQIHTHPERAGNGPMVSLNHPEALGCAGPPSAVALGYVPFDGPIRIPRSTEPLEHPGTESFVQTAVTWTDRPTVCWRVIGVSVTFTITEVLVGLYTVRLIGTSVRS